MNRTRPRSERTSNLWVTLWTTGLATSPKGQCTTRIEVLVGPCFGLGRQLNTTSSVSGSHKSSNPRFEARDETFYVRDLVVCRVRWEFKLQ